jgi:hypothetical protein
MDGSGWRVYSKVRVCDVIEPHADEQTSMPEQRMLAAGHFDFVVVNRYADDLPEFVIEFDGPGHADPRQAARDAVKDELVLRAELPLLRVGHDEIAERDQTTVLEWLIRRFIEHRRFFSNDPDSSSVWEFDLLHTFPGITAVIDRLYRRYGIVCAHWWAWGGPRASLAPLDEAPLQVFPEPKYLESLGLLDSEPEAWFSDTGVATVSVIRPGQEQPVYIAEGRVAPTPQAPFTSPTFTSQWVQHAAAVEIVGLEFDEMRATLAEYLALREVERWAMRALVPLAA